MSLQIVHYNDPVLRQKGEKITVFDAALADLARAMIETMHEAGGIGLAAQQIGRAVQLCVVDLRRSEEPFEWMLDGARPPKDVFMPLTLVNPKVVSPKGAEETVMEEGCLSFPEIRGDVWRPDRITVQFQDERGGPHVLGCNGLLSRCVQHEVDHLKGVLFIDRMKKEVRSGIDEAVKALAKRTRGAGQEQATS
ncbi:MAG TPA: peptide deformylase [Opitutaceae bacterium]|nr:peptide deformylase [Opitutaceae bacterium]